jgi:transformer-2 protein
MDLRKNSFDEDDGSYSTDDDYNGRSSNDNNDNNINEISADAEVSAASSRPPCVCIHVSGLSIHTTNATLHRVFEPYGSLASITVSLDPRTKISRGYCFVTYNSVEDAIKAVETMNNSVIDDKLISVDFAKRQEGFKRTPGQYQGDPKKALAAKYRSDGDRDRDKGRESGGGRRNDDISPRGYNNSGSRERVSYPHGRGDDNESRKIDSMMPSSGERRPDYIRGRSNSRDINTITNRDRGDRGDRGDRRDSGGRSRVDYFDLRIGLLEAELRSLKEEAAIMRLQQPHEDIGFGSRRRSRSRSRSRSRERSNNNNNINGSGNGGDRYSNARSGGRR